MARTTYETTVEITGGDDRAHEIDVKVAYDCSGEDVDGIELLEVAGRARPWGFHWWSDGHFAQLVREQLEGSERHLELMVEAASEDIEAALAERRWEERREFAA